MDLLAFPEGEGEAEELLVLVPLEDELLLLSLPELKLELLPLVSLSFLHRAFPH